jgi:hypothetical protein
LVCDDDPDVRGAMKRTARRCDVTETGSPREALDLPKPRTFVLRVRPEAAPGGG